MTKIELYEEAKETFLQVLLLADTKARKLVEIGDVAGKESLEREVVQKYEELFLSLEEDVILELSEEQIQEFQKILTEIQTKHYFSKEWIQEKKTLRKSLKGHSGAEVVKRLLEYQKKELETQKRKLMEKASALLEQEERKNWELCNAIQEIEQIKIIEELQPLQANYRKISEKTIDIQKKIDYTVRDMEKKWKYEIFGTIPEQELKESYTDFVEKQKN